MSAEAALPVRLVHASRGKVARAEPVAALYEAGRVVHRGGFPALEDQLCGLMLGGGYVGPGRSPDRAGALVRSEEHTSEIQSLMRNTYAVYCLKLKKQHDTT